jgi:ABC-2 type transport system ATP-binding protein
LVETRHLTKRYGSLAALDDCTLQIERGEVFGLLGPNGAGKTTLLRLLLGYLRPTTGSAWIDRLDCHRQRVQVHAQVAYLPGEARLFRQLRPRQVVRLFGALRGDGSPQRAWGLAERLGLDLDRRVAQMSTGMRQKLALVVTLAADVPIVILDEPTANLDPTVRREVLSLVAEARQQGRTVLFSSHVLSEVEQACDRVAVLRAGRLVHLQAMGALRRRHRISARLAGPLAPCPPELAGELAVSQPAPGQVVLETAGELAPLLGWLARLPLAQVRVEPLGLQAVYERFHGPEAAE